jgi:hypothetical protein
MADDRADERTADGAARDRGRFVLIVIPDVERARVVGGRTGRGPTGDGADARTRERPHSPWLLHAGATNRERH